VSWAAPYDNEDTITAYQIQLRQADSLTFTEVVAECDGSQASIITTRECSILLTTLRATPFSLPFNNLIVAQVRA